jgi:hypothetical protein
MEKLSCRGKRSKNVNWKGEEASYFAKHLWMVSNYGNPENCEHCHKMGGPNKGGKWNIHWANKSGEFKRQKSDWLQLCVSCHRKYDYANGAHHTSGETHLWSKLKESDVREIRSKYTPRVFGYRKLAQEYNVTPSAICAIVKRVNWKRVN